MGESIEIEGFAIRGTSQQEQCEAFSPESYLVEVSINAASCRITNNRIGTCKVKMDIRIGSLTFSPAGLCSR